MKLSLWLDVQQHNTDKLHHDIPDEVASRIWPANSELISKLDNTFKKKNSNSNN